MYKVVPDGWIEITLKRWPWDDKHPKSKGPHKLRIHFRDMHSWSQDSFGVKVHYAVTESILGSSIRIPWTNIDCLEWENNSEEVIEALRRERCDTHTDHELNASARALIVETLCVQALADHLDDVRDAEMTLWSLLGVDHPVCSEENAWLNTKKTFENAGINLPDYLKD
jgi:hypothetical protein